MTDFFRFPHTPHLIWLGDGNPRDDKVLSLDLAEELLDGPVVIEEKIDGANIGFSIGADGQLRVQNRGQYLSFPYKGQFTKLAAWIALHEADLLQALGDSLIFFGEWCAARHSLGYDSLPDLFLLFDVYDRNEKKFWDSKRRNLLAKSVRLSVVPELFRGHITAHDAKSLVSREQSCFRKGVLEGIVIRKETDNRLTVRAKIVRPEFSKQMAEHWSRRIIEWNRLSGQ